MIRVLVVDDSATARLALSRLLTEEGEIEIVGDAKSGSQALEQVRALKPDLITMDVQLGEDDGVDVASRIMASSPTPILVVTGLDPGAASLAFRVMEAGALGLAAKPPARGHPQHDREAGRLRRMVRTLASVPVVTRRPRRAGAGGPPRAQTPLPAPRLPLPGRPHGASGGSSIGAQAGPSSGVIAIGASTGGPPLLAEILRLLPAPFPLPVLIAQHIEPGFVSGMAEWLCSTGHRVTCIAAPAALEAGRVFLAADHVHLGLTSSTSVGPIPVEGAAFCPSVDGLFSSVARHTGRAGVGVILTGMGRDGAAGLREIRQAGGSTLAQEPASCVVDGMPKAAIEIGAAGLVLSPAAIAHSLKQLAGAGASTAAER